MKISDVTTYMKYYRTGRGTAPDGTKIEVEKLCGRILRGKNPSDFETLSNDPTRKVIMLLGSDGLQELLNLTHYNQLIKIGYPADWAEGLINGDMQFKLVVFEESEKALPAKWSNVAKVMMLAYPDLNCLKHIPELKDHTWESLSSKYPFDLQVVQDKGKDDENYMTYERFIVAIKNAPEGRPSLLQVRWFLYHTAWLNRLFKGDGYTYDEKGNKQFQESIALNLPVSQLGVSQMVDLSVAKLEV